MVNQYCEEMVGTFSSMTARLGRLITNTQDMEPEEIATAKQELDDYVYGAFEFPEFHMRDSSRKRLVDAAEELEEKMKRKFDRAALLKLDNAVIEEFVRNIKDIECGI